MPINTDTNTKTKEHYLCNNELSLLGCDGQKPSGIYLASTSTTLQDLLQLLSLGAARVSLVKPCSAGSVAVLLVRVILEV